MPDKIIIQPATTIFIWIVAYVLNFILLRGLHPHSPISIVTDSVARTVSRRMKALRFDHKAPLCWHETLSTALEYTDIARRAAFTKERQINSGSESDYSIPEPITDWKWTGLNTLLYVICPSIGIAAVLIIVPLLIIYLVENFAEACLALIGISVIVYVVGRCLDAISNRATPVLQAVPATGTGAHRKSLSAWSAIDFAEQREELIILMSHSVGPKGEAYISDPDLLRVRSGVEVALPPGVTELALGLDDDAAKEMRSHLSSILGKYSSF